MLGSSGSLSRIAASCVAALATMTAADTMLLSSGSAGAADRGTNGVVAFSRGGQIVTLSSNGETVLDPGGPSQTRPAFSPDGTRIAYVSGYHLWIMNSDGSKPRSIPVTTNPYEDDPTWSPDAIKLAYINGTDSQIYTVASGAELPGISPPA